MRTITTHMIKNFHLALLFLIISLTVKAQSPNELNYQAVLRDAAGSIKANKAVVLTISVLQSSASGSVVYSETQSKTTNAFGLVTLSIGTGTVVSGNFAAIDWSAGPYYIKVAVDGTDFGTSKLLSVPYALYAAKSGDGFSKDYNDLTNKPSFDGYVKISSPITGDMIYYDGSKWNTLTKGSEKQILTIDGGTIKWKNNQAPVLTQAYFQFVTYKPGTANPIAFGFINRDGTIASGSGNFTCTYNSGYSRYEITITSQNYFWKDYATVVTTTAISGDEGITPATGSVGGNLLIYMYKEF